MRGICHRSSRLPVLPGIILVVPWIEDLSQDATLLLRLLLGHSFGRHWRRRNWVLLLLLLLLLLLQLLMPMVLMSGQTSACDTSSDCSVATDVMIMVLLLLLRGRWKRLPQFISLGHLICMHVACGYGAWLLAQLCAWLLVVGGIEDLAQNATLLFGLLLLLLLLLLLQRRSFVGRDRRTYWQVSLLLMFVMFVGGNACSHNACA
jgi:uncharacterized protein involved in response to NO